MAVVRLEFTMLPGGSNRINHPLFAYSRLLVVNREGLNYNMTTGAAINREFIHDSGGGGIIFANKPTDYETVIVKLKVI